MGPPVRIGPRELSNYKTIDNSTPNNRYSDYEKESETARTVLPLFGAPFKNHCKVGYAQTCITEKLGNRCQI
eukprot:3705425-Amphidinium_carterae.1